jgi:hypothetical protein
LYGGAKQGDEAHPHGDREVVAKQPEEIDATAQRERHRQQHMGRFED